MDLGAGRLVPEARDGDHMSGRRRHAALHGAGAVRSGRDRDQGQRHLQLRRAAVFPGVRQIPGRRQDARRIAQGASRKASRARSATCAVAYRQVSSSSSRRRSIAIRRGGRSRQPTCKPRSQRSRASPVERTQASFLVVGRGPTARCVVIAACSVAMSRRRPPAVPPLNTLAVLPITNLTGDPAKQYLADGLTEVLSLTWLACPGLQVASSATMAAVRGMDNETSDRRKTRRAIAARRIGAAGRQPHRAQRQADRSTQRPRHLGQPAGAPAVEHSWCAIRRLRVWSRRACL